MDYGSRAARDAFRASYPRDAGVMPVRVLEDMHCALDALDAQARSAAGVDRYMLTVLQQAVESPRAVARSHDGLCNLFFGVLHFRGALHGNPELWRSAARRVPQLKLDGPHAETMEEYARLLWQWVVEFDKLLLEAK